MKILFASDIHGSAFYCRKLLEAYQRENAAKLVICGDILYHGPRNDLPEEYSPKSVISMLNPLKDDIIAVRGNCDAEVDQMVLDFNIEEPFREMKINGINFVVTHGQHYNKKNPFSADYHHVLVCGHFHIPEITDCGSFIYINVGSVAIPKNGTAHSYGILDGTLFALKELDGIELCSIDLQNRN